MNNEMTPELLVLLSTEQQEAWERCQNATPGPWQQDGGGYADTDLAALIERIGK